MCPNCGSEDYSVDPTDQLWFICLVCSNTWDVVPCVCVCHFGSSVCPECYMFSDKDCEYAMRILARR